MVYNAQSGHIGGSLSAVEIMTVLFHKCMKLTPKWDKDKEFPNRDRFVLSKGHTAPGLYSVLAQRGFFPAEELKTLRKIGSRLQGHPNMNMTPGVDMSTGSLGQGVSAAVRHRAMLVIPRPARAANRHAKHWSWMDIRERERSDPGADRDRPPPWQWQDRRPLCVCRPA